MKISAYHTIVLGSGAAGLAAAVRLHAAGIDNLVVVTEGLAFGTSINTGSDKQTYYKPSLCGGVSDSPRAVAETYCHGGGADGDLALVEAATATRAFFHLVDLGVPFPHDSYGQYAGYRTDHDPANRATSCGPYTSREMCVALSRECRRRGVTILENLVAAQLLDVPVVQGEVVSTTEAAPPRRKVVGVVCVNCATGEYEVFRAENIVFAVGGPGGLYERSVYPEVHTGAIGLALRIGASAQGLAESQFGLASFTSLEGRELIGERFGALPKEFRWNVSGTFMQVIPKLVSTEPDGVSSPREFLRDYFDSDADAQGLLFLKGYQWPFDARKAQGGSSLVDLCVFYETSILGRRVFLDYRSNPEGYSFESLPEEAREYLQKSGATQETPFLRLAHMNPGAVALYRDWGIDLERETLEIGVCAQHNNGGLAVDSWYRSENIEGLWPIGEVSGTHGVARPGGSALNAGQVGAFRVAERIAFEARRHGASKEPTISSAFVSMAVAAVEALDGVVAYSRDNGIDWRVERAEFRRRMTESGGFLRSRSRLEKALSEASAQLERLYGEGKARTSYEVIRETRRTSDDVELLRNLQLCLAHKVYLDAIYANVVAGVGSRGSQLTLSSEGMRLSERFPEDWLVQPENHDFRELVCQTFLPCYSESALSFDSVSRWRSVRPIPVTDEWFENVWRDYREGTIYN